jgi:hypothetical protein
MAACLENCKWICITAYVLAAIGSIVLWLQQDYKLPAAYKVSKWLIRLYAIAAVVTLGCSIKWGMMKTPSSSSLMNKLM